MQDQVASELEWATKLQLFCHTLVKELSMSKYFYVSRLRIQWLYQYMYDPFIK